jgi:hypothetical protein
MSGSGKHRVAVSVLLQASNPTRHWSDIHWRLEELHGDMGRNLRHQALGESTSL